MSRRKYLTSVVLILSILLFALQGLAAAKTPDWVYADTRSDYNKFYFTGYGEGSDRASASSAAVEDAKENIAEYIGVAVFSRRSSSWWSFDDNNNATVQYNSETIQHSTAYDGSGMVVEERFYDTSKSCWVLVSIDASSLSKAAKATEQFREDTTDAAYSVYGYPAFSSTTVNPFDLTSNRYYSPDYYYAIGYGHGKDLHTSIEKAQAEARAAIAENRLFRISSDNYYSVNTDYNWNALHMDYNLYSGVLIFGSKQLAMMVEKDGGVWVLMAAPIDYVKGWFLEDEKRYLNAALADTQFYYPIGKSFLSTSYDPQTDYKVRIDTFNISIPTNDKAPDWYFNTPDNYDYFYMVGVSEIGSDIYTAYRAADLAAKEVLSEYYSIIMDEIDRTDENGILIGSLDRNISDALIPNTFISEVSFDGYYSYVLLNSCKDDFNWIIENSSSDDILLQDEMFYYITDLKAEPEVDYSAKGSDYSAMNEAIARYFGS